MGAIDVLAWDPGWAPAAGALITELRDCVPGVWQQIEHIGSTSVPGLAAKPVIDLMASTAELNRCLQLELTSLLPLRYVRTETGMTGRLFYGRDRATPPSSALTVHLHVVPTRCWATQNERILRDHLISHPADAQRYGDLKRRLAAALDDPVAYTRAKTALIQELVDRARSDRGLPLVNVWPD